MFLRVIFALCTLCCEQCVRISLILLSNGMQLFSLLAWVYICYTFNLILVIWHAFSVLNAVGNTLAYIPIYIFLTVQYGLKSGEKWRGLDGEKRDGIGWMDREGERKWETLTGWKKSEGPPIPLVFYYSWDTRSSGGEGEEEIAAFGLSLEWSLL